MHLVNLGSIYQILYCLMPTQSQNPSCFCMRSFYPCVLRCEPLIILASSSFCTENYSPPQSDSGVTFPLASSWFVSKPHHTDRGPALILIVTAAFQINDQPHKLTQAFLVCVVLTNTVPKKTLGHPSQNCSKSIILNFRVLKLWATENKIHLVSIGSTHQIL